MTLGHPTDATHLAQCGDCQARATLGALDIDLDRIWSGVAAEVWATPAGRFERGAAALLGSPGLARALVTTPSLVLAWVLATAAVFAVGVVATYTSDTPWVALVAPVLAGAGIAYAYGPGADPAFELGRSMAISDRTVLLTRAVAVFGVNALLGVAASLVASEAGALTWGWLAPMAAVSALALAGSTISGSANVGVGTALGAWAIVVLGSAVETRDLASAANPGALAPAYLVVAVLAGAVALWASERSGYGTPLWR
jgi:hypothetical protein